MVYVYPWFIFIHREKTLFQAYKDEKQKKEDALARLVTNINTQKMYILI